MISPVTRPVAPELLYLPAQLDGMGKKLLKNLEEATAYLHKQYKGKPEAGIVLGSGLGNFTAEINVLKEVPYEDIPHFPVSTVAGHSGKLIFGTIAGKEVVAMAGRFHLYEGYEPAEVIFPIRVMKMLGVKTLFLSNAAGGVNPSFKVGDLMIINDHISFYIPNPLVGKNTDELGPRFPDMSQAYDKKLISRAKAIASNAGFDIKEGVYVAVTGPTFETPAEYRMIHNLGADVVGMSTVQENIAARHMGMDVFAISVITDMWHADHAQTISHEEVLVAARSAEPKLARVFRELVAGL